jgi:hypothetical protein
MIRRILRAIVLWCCPELARDTRFERLQSACIDLSSAGRKLEVSMAEQQRFAQELGRLVMQHEHNFGSLEMRVARLHGEVMSSGLATVKAADQRCLYVTEQLGKTNTRVALLELYMARPLYDGPAADGRLDEALENARLMGGNGDVKS